MKILISNDDGILAPGILALISAFAGAGHEVLVAAPDRQRSAASHSMTLFSDLTAKPMRIPGAKSAYAISGTPVDCVKLGLRKLFPDAEFVISGINNGYNAGTDVLYSGTVGAAMEGALNGRPAMAVSIAYNREDNYDRAAEAALDVFDRMQAYALPPMSVLNLNYPACDRALGLKAAPLKPTGYTESYVEQAGEEGVRVFGLGFAERLTAEPGDDDCTWIDRGYATLTVLTYDMTHVRATQALAGAL